MFVITAAISSLIAGILFCFKFIDLWQRRRVLFSISGNSARGKLDTWVNLATRIFGRIAPHLLRFEQVGELSSNIVYLARIGGANLDEVRAVSALLGCSSLAAILAFFLTLGPVFPVCIFLLCWILTITITKNRIDKVSTDMREQVPEALRCMAACSRSGLSLMQSLEATSRECTGSLSTILSTASKRLKLGALTSEALSVMRNTHAVAELKFVAVALDVQHTSGGAISPILESARDSVLNEIELLRNLRVQTSQARLSATIVTLMPFILLALFSFISPDFLLPFFTTPAGIVLFAIAIIMQMTGVVIVRRILNISGGGK